LTSELKKIKFFSQKLDSKEDNENKVELEDEFHHKLNKFNKKLFNQVDDIKKKVVDNKEVVLSYNTFFSNSKIMFSSFLQEFLIKDDLVEIENKTTYNINNQHKDKPRKQELKIKNEFIKLLLVMTYYEKTLFEGLNKITVDLKKIIRNEFYSCQYDHQINRYQNVFNKMIPLLDQIKEMKIYNFNGMNNDQLDYTENGGTFQGKKIKTLTFKNIRRRYQRRSSKTIDSNNTIQNLQNELNLEENKQFKLNIEDMNNNIINNNNCDDDVFITKSQSQIPNSNLNSNLNLNINGGDRIYKNNKVGVVPSQKSSQKQQAEINQTNNNNNNGSIDNNPQPLELGHVESLPVTKLQVKTNLIQLTIFNAIFNNFNIFNLE